MSLDILLSAEDDLAINGDLSFVDGAERIAQQIKITLKTFLGEWFLDTSHGIPYFEKIFIKQPNRAEVEAILRTKIKDVPGVKSVGKLALSVDAQTRQLFVDGEANTDEGIVKIQLGV